MEGSAGRCVGTGACGAGAGAGGCAGVSQPRSAGRSACCRSRSPMTITEKAAQMQNGAPGIERLGVLPYDYWNEALHGVARAGEATVFPQAIGKIGRAHV